MKTFPAYLKREESSQCSQQPTILRIIVNKQVNKHSTPVINVLNKTEESTVLKLSRVEAG
jgi:hypothetical protein